MRALAAHQLLEVHPERGEITKPLNAEIQVGVGSFLKGKYRACAGGAHLASFTSLHRAKNAIRRHFGIESRRQLRWEEVQR